jgi:hypothetical protein
MLRLFGNWACLGVVLTLGLCAVATLARAAVDGEIVKVTGKLRMGLVAIGGETTGSAVNIDGITWELDFDKNPSLKQTAEKMDGKQVCVEGPLEYRQGVEVKDRRIIVVRKLWLASSKQ